MSWPIPFRHREAPARRPTAAWALIPLLVSACGGPAPGTTLDLAANPDLAAFQPETRVVDFGTPAARSVMQNGWNTLDERWLGERTFVWGRGAASRIRFQVFRPGGRTLRMTGRPNPGIGDSTLPVAVVVNGELLETIEVTPGWNEYRVAIPASRLRRGANRLELHYRGAPADSGQLQVAWDVMRLGPPWEYGAPGVATVDGELALQVPFFSELEYFQTAGAGGRLTLGPIGVYGEQVQARDAALEVSIRIEDALEPQVHRIAAGEFERAHEISLGVQDTVPVSVALRALPGYEPGRPSGLTIRAPVLHGRVDPEVGGSWPAAGRRPPSSMPNLLVYVVDTLRADHLGLYGYPLATSPRLDEFAADATVFEHAFTQSGWTRTSVASLMTGLLPTAHGVNARDDALDPEALTVAGLLRDLGYTTVGLITNGNVSDQFGFAAGFERYTHLRERKTPEIHVLAHELNDEFLAWLDDRPENRPFFAYLHASDPHDPYVPLPRFRERFPSPMTTGVVQPRAIAEAQAERPELTDEMLREDLVALYDAEIAQTDDAFGELVDALAERGLADNTVIVFVADHGEEFLDHGRWAHGKTLYREMIRTPLVVRVPELPGGRTDVLAQHTDILPTLLDLAGGEAPAEVQGRSLLPWLVNAQAPAPPRSIRSYLDLDGYSLASLITPEFHLIRPGMKAPGVSLGGSMLFDLLDDPAQVRELRAIYRARTGELLTRLRLFERGETLLHEPGRAEIDDELRDRLRALGYIQ